MAFDLANLTVRRPILGRAWRPALVGVALIVSLCAWSTPPTQGAGDPQVLERADVTYELARTRARVEVTAKVTYTNQVPNRGRTRIYMTTHGPLWVPTYARNFSVSGGRVRAHLETTANGYRVYSFTFPRIFRGQRVAFTARWVLPSKGADSSNPTRVTRAYSHFCWRGQPVDVGSVSVVLPRGLSVQTAYGKVRDRTTAKQRRIEARGKDLAAFYACSDVYDHAQLRASEFTSPMGRRVILNAWPGDEVWLRQAELNVGFAMSRIEELVGVAAPGDDPVRVYQAAKNALSGYSGDFNPGSSIIRIEEGTANGILIAHELAHAWFNSRTFDRPWMSEGLADWVAFTVAGYRCPEPLPPPGDLPRLSRWQYLGFKPTDDEKALVAYQYRAACTVVQQMADVVGRDRMQDVLRVLLAGEPTYDRQAPEAVPGSPATGAIVTPSARHRTDSAGWRDWLDAVEEYGLVPAGVSDHSFGQGLLVDAGVIRESAVEGRAGARAALAVLRALTPNGLTPAIVRRRMGSWDFDAALVVIPLAIEVATLISIAPPSVDPTAAWGRFESATDARALRAQREDLS